MLTEKGAEIQRSDTKPSLTFCTSLLSLIICLFSHDYWKRCRNSTISHKAITRILHQSTNNLPAFMCSLKKVQKFKDLSQSRQSHSAGFHVLTKKSAYIQRSETKPSLAFCTTLLSLIISCFHVLTEKGAEIQRWHKAVTCILHQSTDNLSVFMCSPKKVQQQKFRDLTQSHHSHSASVYVV